MEESITQAAREKAATEAEEAERAEEVSREEAAAQERQRSERALDHIAEIWVEMAETEPFRLLEQELDNQARRYRAARFDSLMRGDEVNQREVDYERGLIDGLARHKLIIETARKRLRKREQGSSEPETTETEGSYW